VPGLVELLAPMSPRVEAELKPRLQGFLGGIIRAYLPQHWVFETETEKATVTIAKDGGVSVAPGAVDQPDVTVRAPRSQVEAIAKGGPPPARRPDDVQVAAHTARGRAALEQVRKRFGF
jgi:hypothetical protein